MNVLCFLLLLISVPALSSARDLWVDPVSGNDASATGPFRTIPVAIRRAVAGDTIHLKPVVYHDYAGFYGIRGEPGKPIILDGHGATLEGSEPLDPGQWQEISPGLFKADQLLPKITDAMIQRWFFLCDGRMNHMGRTSKGPREPLKAPEDLQPGEWTFVRNPDAEDSGTFYLRLESGQSLSEANIRFPVRSAGVQFGGSGKNHNAHLVIRNLTATHPYNDGFNIHGHCENVKFENIRAIECGDDGISAHETAQYTVDGFVSIGNSTGICDTGESQTEYNRVLIKDCLGHDLFFLNSGRYHIKNAVVHSHAARSLVVTGRNNNETPCSLTLENVWIKRTGAADTMQISEKAVFNARNVTLENLSLTAKSGSVDIQDSILSGTRLEIYPEVTWTANNSQLTFEQTVGLNTPPASIGADSAPGFRHESVDLLPAIPK